MDIMNELETEFAIEFNKLIAKYAYHNQIPSSRIAEILEAELRRLFFQARIMK